MINPIKRVWVAPHLAKAQAEAQPQAAPPPQAPTVSAAPAQPARKQVFIDLPETEIEEKDSDSVWAEFGSVMAKLPKAP